MRYLLEICRNVKHEISDPTPEQIDAAIDEMLPMIHHYVILSRSESVHESVCKHGVFNGNLYIQTCLDRDDDVENIYCVETRFVHEMDEQGNHISFTHYRKETADIKLVKRLFRMYALDENPDVSDWEDVTESLKPKKPPKKS